MRGRLFLPVARRIAHSPGDDVLTMSLYRPRFFGRTWLRLVRRAMRGPSYWSAQERELIGAATSRANQCPYCVEVHTRIAELEDRPSPGPRPQFLAVLNLVTKLSADPDEVSPADIDAIRSAGAPTEAIEEAIYINYIFNVINRLAHAFAFQWQSDEHVAAGAQALHRFGYNVPSLLTR
jgi:alkylhydroperoxidase family enzyme